MNGSEEPKVSILLVDDQPEGLMALEATLASLGQDLVRAGSGREALRQLLRQDFAVILLDVVMPDMDGFETAQLIRERARSRDTPIIFLTALSQGQLPQFKAYSVGAVDYLLKPLDPDMLRSKVSVFVDLAKKTELLKRQAEALRAIQQREHERELAEVNRRVEEERAVARAELLRRELETGRNQQRWLEAILDAIPTPLLLIDPGKGFLMFHNAAARALGGGIFVSPPGVLPRGSAFTDAAGAPLAAEALPTSRAARGEQLEGVQVDWRGPDGRRGSALVFSRALPAMFGHREAVVVKLLDITALKRTELDLHLAVRARDEFLSMASHELKTPLTSLKMTVQGLLYGLTRSPHLLEDLPDRLRRLDRNVGRLGSLVDRLLDISRISAGRLDLELDEVDLREVVEDVAARYQDELQRAGCALSVRASGPVVGRWDRARLDQVITNLLTNAIKYAGGKPVEISVGAEAGQAELAVRDQGIGIAPEHQERIFDRFERAVPHRNVSGFGLGLWIVREIVTALGGTVRVTSQPGVGSTFTVSLPMAAGQERGERVGEVRPGPASAALA